MAPLTKVLALSTLTFALTASCADAIPKYGSYQPAYQQQSGSYGGTGPSAAYPATPISTPTHTRRKCIPRSKPTNAASTNTTKWTPGSTGDQCVSKHLEEAIALNQQRKPLYSSMTNGLSERVSDFLIQSETIALRNSRAADLAAIPFQKQGINILCDEMIPMERAPAIQSKPIPPKVTELVPARLDGQALAAEIQAAFAATGFEGVSKVAGKHLHSLEESAPDYYCMSKHLLESIVRSANYATKHIEDAKAKGLQATPETISTQMVKTQVEQLPGAALLDALAYPVQKMGVGIICNDVPKIPPF
ncbi:hypothetical protein HK102_002919 [Quaeritorhiza haematococci]|nr:hypothetical protein HK102_002919 [Quaeritorhiza haematococci]